jgi:hypothetical protein
MPHHVSIRAGRQTLGRTRQKMLAYPTSLAEVYLAGFAAEHVLTGRRPDQYKAETGLGILAHTDPFLISTLSGVRESDGYGAVHCLVASGVRPAEDELRQEVDQLYEIAQASVGAVWLAIKAVACALLLHEELDRDGIGEVLSGFDIYSPVLAVQEAHGLLRPLNRPNAGRAERRSVEARMTSGGKPVKTPTRTAGMKTAGADDPRVATLLKALRRTPTLAPAVEAYEKQAAEAQNKFGKNGLKTRDGKLFVLFTQGTLVVKLPKQRVASLVDEGIGKPFDPGHGRLMKEWLTVTNPKASWVELTKEAFAFVERAR